jgi:hypothetical protein
MWVVTYATLVIAFVTGFSIGGYFGLFAPAFATVAGGLDLAATWRNVTARGEEGAGVQSPTPLIFAVLGAVLTVVAGIVLTAGWYVDGVDKALTTSIAAVFAVAAVRFRVRGMAWRCAGLVGLWAVIAAFSAEFLYIFSAAALIVAAQLTPRASAEVTTALDEPPRSDWLLIAAVVGVLAVGVYYVTYAAMSKLAVLAKHATPGPHIYTVGPDEEEGEYGDTGAVAPARPYVPDRYEPDDTTTLVHVSSLFGPQAHTLRGNDIDWIGVRVSALPLTMEFTADGHLSIFIDDGTADPNTFGEFDDCDITRTVRTFTLESDGVLPPDHIVYIRVTSCTAKRRPVTWSVR